MFHTVLYFVLLLVKVLEKCKIRTKKVES